MFPFVDAMYVPISCILIGRLTTTSTPLLCALCCAPPLQCAAAAAASVPPFLFASSAVFRQQQGRKRCQTSHGSGKLDKAARTKEFFPFSIVNFLFPFLFVCGCGILYSNPQPYNGHCVISAMQRWHAACLGFENGRCEAKLSTSCLRAWR